MKTPKNTVERVLLAVDASSRSYDALEAAAEFASALKAHLEALFIEDVNLVKLAELPFAKELDRSSGIVRPLSVDSVVRSLQADAQRLQKRLTAESAKRRISVSMKVVRGHYLTTAVKLAKKRDIVCLYHEPAPSFPATGRRDRALRAAPRTGSTSVWVFYDGSGRARRGLAIALDLVEHLGLGLTVVLAEGLGRADLEAQLGRVAGPGSSRDYRLLRWPEVQALSPAGRVRDCSVLVLPRKVADKAQYTDSVLSRIPCLRILV